MKRASNNHATDRLRLRAGPLELRFEPALLWARHWMRDEVEVLRAVYPALRDTHWNTLQPRIRWRRAEIHSDRFALELKARYGGRRVYFEWELRLEGTPDGRVAYGARGVALETFRANRVGFCVLHPAEAAGRHCRIEHTDGTSEAAVFPREISPEQPFFDLRAITHSPAPGMRVEVRMEGEVFEMEDQRNWTDASFKTYCPPLQRQRPFVIRRGKTIEQHVEVRVSAGMAQSRGSPPRERRDTSRRISAPFPAGSALTEADCILTVERRSTRMPAIGVAHSEDSPLSTIAADILRGAGVKRLRVDLETTSAACLARWTRAIADVAKLGADASLEVALKVGANDRLLEKLARHIEAGPVPGATRWLVLDHQTGMTDTTVFGRVETVWSRHRINGLLGGGVGGGFVDFNRSRLLVPGIEFVSFGVDAQVHASDETSMLETLSTYPLVVAQARRISRGLPVTVSPVGFGTPRTGKHQREDSRQRAAFGGVWMLASLAALARAKANSATFLLPRLEAPTPALRVLIACASPPLAHARGHERERVGRACLIASSQPQHACGVSLRTSTGFRVLIANLRGEEQRVRMQGLPSENRRVTLISSDNRVPKPRAVAGNTVLTLPAYAVVQIDFSSGA